MTRCGECGKEVKHYIIKRGKVLCNSCASRDFVSGMGALEGIKIQIDEEIDRRGSPSTPPPQKKKGKWTCKCKGGKKRNNASKLSCGRCGTSRPW